jgi:uncharacterized tellurite resistance protein B-like protein
MAVLTQIKLLISLAQIDGRVAEREQNYIINIGRANGIYPDEIVPLLEQRHPLVVPADLSNETKFSYIFSLVQLMKIDERMYKEEVLFCSKIAARLGYDQRVMLDLIRLVKNATMEATEMDALQKLTEKYLSTKGV